MLDDELTDEEFVNSVVDALDRRVDETRFGKMYLPGGLRNFTHPERVILRAIWSMGLIENGGFQYFYEGAINTVEVAEAYEALGYSKAAEACRRSLRAFPKGIPPEDQEKRLAILQRFQGFRNLFFRPLNEIVWEAGGDGFEAAMAAYIRTHSADFKDLN